MEKTVEKMDPGFFQKCFFSLNHTGFDLWCCIYNCLEWGSALSGNIKKA
ncbi:hypothetical protein SAMN02746065_10168 [Desulfocicer vacuolatum DSM 3385]|uniref:Uncharacterized protein n=1 Tax=Desulfocicer vacuolatum DSM 3385 TaxID=1121400 RepID=A0A1W1YIW5_9BACT|nr:hypothetical protein SAMN02746065_10168 [Desulfocicer vacuolatum DSM 3385]